MSFSSTLLDCKLTWSIYFYFYNY